MDLISNVELVVIEFIIKKYVRIGNIITCILMIMYRSGGNRI